MASPVMPPPPMMPPPRPPRSVAGAVVLILLGVLFLMGTMGVLNWHGLIMLFGRYWPALLILWGVIKLIEHEQYKRAGLPGRGIGVGGVFLMQAFDALGEGGETFRHTCLDHTASKTDAAMRKRARPQGRRGR